MPSSEAADCTSHLNEQDCLIHGCEYDGHCYMPSSEAAVSNPLPEEKSVGEDICAGNSCSECLDGTDYACSFYDGKCILSESMKDPAAYKASKFVWMSEECTDEDSYETEDICAGKACGECLDDTDYACGFYDGKCIPVESMTDPSAYKMSKFVWSSGDCGAAVACDDISIMDGSFTCGGLAAILGDLCNTDYGASGAPCACMCEATVSNPLPEEATISNPLPEEKSVGKDICAGKSCSECLDGTDYACSFYDGKCILSESMKDPAAYKASKFVWMSDECTDEGSYEKEDICAGKGCGECPDDTDYACGFYDGKCIPVESMMDPSAYKMSKFVWSSGDCGAAVACDDISIMDGSFTCGGLAAILGDLCNTDYGASGAPCACMCESSVGNSQCALIN